MNKRRWLAHNSIRVFGGHTENKQLAAEIRMRMKKGKFFRVCCLHKIQAHDNWLRSSWATQTWSTSLNTKFEETIELVEKQLNRWRKCFKILSLLIFPFSQLSSTPLTTWEKVWSEKYEVSCFTKYVQRKVHSLFASFFFFFFTFFLLCLTSAAATVAVCIPLVFRSRLLFD